MGLSSRGRILLAKIVVYCAAAVVRSAVLVAVVICGEGGPTQGAVVLQIPFVELFVGVTDAT